MMDWGIKGRGFTFVGLAIALGAVAYMVGVESAEAGAPPAVVSFEEGMTPGSFVRTVRLTGAGLNRVKGVFVSGPSPAVTPRSVSILLASKETVVLALPSGIPQGDYYIQLLDRKSDQIASASVRLNLGAPGVGSIPATSISGQIPATQISGSIPAAQISGSINAATLGGLSSTAFLRTTGGTMTGAISFVDGTGATRAYLDASVLRFSDPGGKKRLEAGVQAGGDSWWAVFDPSGNFRSQICHVAQGDTTGLYFVDTDGVYRGALAEGLGAVGLVILDSDGTVMVDLEGSDVWGFLTVADFLGNDTTYGP